MDAQNAAEAASTKPAASSSPSSASSRPPPPAPHDAADRPKASVVAPLTAKSPTLARAAPPAPPRDRDVRAVAASSVSAVSASLPSAPNASKDPVRQTASSKGTSVLVGSPSLPPKPPRPATAVVPPTVPSTTPWAAPPPSSSREKADDDGGGTDGNSEAETIVLSKDGSPAKPSARKVIKHEAKDRPNGVSASSTSTSAAASSKHASDNRKDGSASDRRGRASADVAEGAIVAASASSAPPKKKRLHEKLQSYSQPQQAHARAKDSSSLSSAPASPSRSRNASLNLQSGSDSDRGPRSKSPKRSSSSAPKDRLRPPEKLVPHKRKAPKAESDDEAESRNARRLRLAGGSGDGTSHSSSRPSKHGDTARSGSHAATVTNGNGSGSGTAGKTSSSTAASRSHRDTSQTRSVSPPPRSHRRSLSTHLPSRSNGLGLKKKRVPAPLQSTDYNSDESSAGGSPRVRSSRPRSLATPATAESAISPAKIGPHKKHLDAHGQTFLARACARGELELAKQRLQERPEDLNVADFAGNTPLQIAAINGYGEIVKFLIDSGCNLDCVNYDKDTPLLDAVDNGHLEVVRLLLDAGVNPRKANVHGEEPLDRVGDDIENADEIRAALIEAKKRIGGRRFTSEEQRCENDGTRALPGPESPRRAPPAPAGASGASSSRRSATVRATKTSNHLLYMPMDDKTLREAAARGDEQNVIRILQVRDAFDDPESMVAAARGGHDLVMQLLLALGKANPDPAPIASAPPEHATPILAAVGQENIKVVSLLLEQNAFDPTRRFNGQTYYEIARQRAGPNWKEEEDILKKAYDTYKKTHGSRKDSESRRANRTTATAEAHGDTSSLRTHKRKLSSPTRERSKKATSASTSTATGKATTATSPREGRTLQKRPSDHSSASHGDGKASPTRRGSSTSIPASRQKVRDEHNSVTPTIDRDTPPPSKRVSKPKKADPDSVVVISDGEAVKPKKKKLVSGRELKDEKVREREKERERERERQRRASMASTNTTTPSKESSSPREPRQDDPAPEKIRADKHRERDRDRTRQLKKEESKESASGASGEGSVKRHRLSETPPRVVVSDKDASEAPVKRRRLEADSGNGHSKEKKTSASSSKSSASPESVLPSKSSSKSAARDAAGPAASSHKPLAKRRDDDDRKTLSVAKTKKRDVSSERTPRRDSMPQSETPTERSIHVKAEDSDVEMGDVSADERLPDKEDDKKKKAADDEAMAAANDAKKKKEEEEEEQRRQQEEDEKKKKEEKRKKDEEKRKKEEEEAQAKRKEEEERKKQEAAEKKKREEEEAGRRRREEEERERKRLENEERKRKEEEEKKRREEEEAERRRREEEERARKLEEDRKRWEEEERQRLERLEKEAAEEARRKLEEEARRERERQEQERIRAEKEAEERRRRQQEEEERVRIAQLPPVLRWLSTCATPRSTDTARLFRTMQGVRHDCLDPSATGTAEGREQWLLNTQVALVLGEKDLSLRQHASWRRIPASTLAKHIIWRLESDRYALTDPDLYPLGKQLPGYYGGDGPETMSYFVQERLRHEAWEKFSSTDMFFVKVSDVMDVVASAPHLRGVRLTLEYREVPEHESQLKAFVPTQKWKSDPGSDQNYGFAPGNKYFVNGVLVKEQRAGLAAASKTPFPEVRVPRRGLVAVSIDDPDFGRLCKEQGIDPATFASYARAKPKLANGVAAAATASTKRTAAADGRNGTSSPGRHAAAVNGSGGDAGVGRALSMPGSLLPRPIVNGSG